MKTISVTPLCNICDAFKVMSVTRSNLRYVKNICYAYFKVIEMPKELARVTDDPSRCLFLEKNFKTKF